MILKDKQNNTGTGDIYLVLFCYQIYQTKTSRKSAIWLFDLWENSRRQ